jgi:hypothetical protein
VVEQVRAGLAGNSGLGADGGIDRVRRTPLLAYSFLRHAGLPVS